MSNQPLYSYGAVQKAASRYAADALQRVVSYLKSKGASIVIPEADMPGILAGLELHLPPPESVPQQIVVMVPPGSIRVVVEQPAPVVQVNPEIKIPARADKVRKTVFSRDKNTGQVTGAETFTKE